VAGLAAFVLACVLVRRCRSRRYVLASSLDAEPTLELDGETSDTGGRAGNDRMRLRPSSDFLDVEGLDPEGTTEGTTGP
jgi:hypothetical protein